VLNLFFIVLQPVPPLCEYKVWINTERCAEVKCYLRSMVELNMMDEEFHARMMEEHRRAAFFARQHEMDHEEYKEKREQERVWKHDVRRKRMSKVVRKRSGRSSGHVLLKIDGLVHFECIDVLY
jgi:hypothetical protein